MDTKWLQDFLVLAEVRNFTRAAELRFCSQAAFSRRIQSLENWVGTSLVDRSRYPLYLTREGEEFLKKAETLIIQLEDARSETNMPTAMQNVRIALPYTLAVLWLPKWWQKVNNKNNKYALQTLVGNVFETTATFAAGTADLLINYQQISQSVPVDDKDFEKIVLFSETIRPYCSKNLLAKKLFNFPGTPDKPVPYFHYSKEAYFHRILKGLLEDTKGTFHGELMGESEMSEVLAMFALEGLGVSWLSDTTLSLKPAPNLVNLDKNNEFSIKIDVVAYLYRSNPHNHVHQLWSELKKHK